MAKKQLLVTKKMWEDSQAPFEAAYKQVLASIPKGAKGGEDAIYFCAVKAVILATDTYIEKYGYLVGGQLFAMVLAHITEVTNEHLEELSRIFGSDDTNPLLN